MAEAGLALRLPCGEPPGAPAFEIRALSVFHGERAILRDVELDIAPRSVFGLIGPSGVGKSTLLKCLNRLIDLQPGLSTSGMIAFQGRSIRDRTVDPDALRCRIGILFQQPVVFPGSILRNVLFGLRHVRTVPKRMWTQSAEQALRQANLWDEVRNRLHEPAARLSVGQQQRLCLARTLAVEPEAILMDEPTSALDPASTEMIEDLILRLKETRTVVVVTHNLRQARRVADRLARLALVEGVGRVVACGRPDEVLDPVDG